MRPTQSPVQAPVQAYPFSAQPETQRANEIIHALIQQTSQEDWDELTVDQLVSEYQRLVS